jgi:hypothetical protein
MSDVERFVGKHHRNPTDDRIHAIARGPNQTAVDRFGHRLAGDSQHAAGPDVFVHTSNQRGIGNRQLRVILGATEYREQQWVDQSGISANQRQ